MATEVVRGSLFQWSVSDLPAKQVSELLSCVGAFAVERVFSSSHFLTTSELQYCTPTFELLSPLVNFYGHRMSILENR